MAKDPAMLFYPNDWLGGTLTFSRPQKGAYMDLLVAQFNGGHLHIDDIVTILGPDYETMWEQKLKSKFSIDPDGKFYNERLDNEKNKRSNFSESRRANRKKPVEIEKTDNHMSSHINNHMSSHMENENENINDINILNKKKQEFEKEVLKYENDFPPEIRKQFLDYWLELHRNKKSYRYESEKFFDFKKRLSTFLKNNKTDYQKALHRDNEIHPSTIPDKWQ